jgi:hypothetical protein
MLIGNCKKINMNRTRNIFISRYEQGTSQMNLIRALANSNINMNAFQPPPQTRPDSVSNENISYREPETLNNIHLCKQFFTYTFRNLRTKASNFQIIYQFGYKSHS